MGRSLLLRIIPTTTTTTHLLLFLLSATISSAQYSSTTNNIATAGLVVVAGDGTTDPPTPTPWPERFHAVTYMNMTATGKLVVTDLWYDWPRGRNFNIMQQQLGHVIYDIEWDNGTSFYYTPLPGATGGGGGSCLTRHFPVGIPRPDFLAEGSTYLGRRVVDGGFLCHVWEKLDFIWYYEDVDTHRPVRWDFFDGITMHVMTFEVGAALDDARWQAPAYCFDGGDEDEGSHRRVETVSGGDEVEAASNDKGGFAAFDLRRLI